MKMADSLTEIKTREEETGSDADQQICNMCLRDFAKYTCPRCNARYCSLNCYRDKKHMQCSEGFYRDSFMAELQQRKGSPAEKRRMLEMLKRLEEENGGGVGGETEDEETATESLADRMSGLDLDREADLVWERLTVDERREFHHLVQSGKLGHLVDVYTPWWEVSQPAVQPLEKGLERSPGTQPEVLVDLPPLNTLIKGGQVSPTIQYNVLSVLYAYAYMVRLFNGGHHNLPVQASEVVLNISTCLSANTSFTMAGEALKLTMATVQQTPELFNSLEFSNSVLEDVSHILSHPKSHDCQVTRALSDLHRLLAAARSQLKANSDKDTLTEGQSKRLWQVKKKVYFFTVWSRENSETVSLLAKVVAIEHATAVREMEERAEAEREVGRERVRPRGTGTSGGSTAPSGGTVKLIEELN